MKTIYMFHSIVLLFIFSGCSNSSNNNANKSSSDLPPTLNSVTATDGTYGSGASIILTATFNKTITVDTSGFLVLDVGGIEVRAPLSSNGSSSSHEFTYTVDTSHSDTDGIEITGFQVFSGGNISTLRQNISLSHVLIDTTAGPQAMVSRVPGESGSIQRNEVMDVIITFNEDVQNFDENDITVSAGVTKSHFVMSTARKYWISVTPPQTGSTFSVSVAEGVTQNSSDQDNIGIQTLPVSVSGTCTSGGTGDSTSDPIIICNYQGLKDIDNDLTKHYRLGGHINVRASWFEGDSNCLHYNGDPDPDDISSNCAGLTPLGELTGSLDGANFEIRNLYINSNSYTVGLFSEIQGDIKNLHLRHVRIIKHPDNRSTGQQAVGALIGLSDTPGPSFNNCSVVGKITSFDNESLVGGLAGDLEAQGVSNSWADVIVSSKGSSGGLVGGCGSGCSIVSSWSQGEVNKISSTLTNHVFGGLVGGIHLGAKIQNSYSHANVSGSGALGGFVGSVYSAEVYNSYSTGTVTAGQGHGFVGNLVYIVGDGNLGLQHNFWDTESSGRSEARSLPSNSDQSSETVEAPTGLTTSEIQKACTNSDGVCALGSGFQFTAGQYPKIKKCTTCSGILVFSSELVGGQ